MTLVDSIFATDLLLPMIETAQSMTGRTYGLDERTDVGLRILADHGRAMSMLIADGVLPSNEGRGYVLRRIIRRAVRRARQFGVAEFSTPRLVDAAVGILGAAYPVLAESHHLITDVVTREEEGFLRTLATGSAMLDEQLASGATTLPGDVAFRLHDTYGFPLELTVEIAPTQLRLRACRLTPEAQAGIAEALCTADTSPSIEAPEHQMMLGGAVDRYAEAEVEPAVAAESAGAVEREVRVLTNAATITGAAEEVMAGSGRHFELVALLALSGSLTKEDARAAIYGSGSSADNVTNVASQARKMLGTDGTGQLFLPEAGSKGVLALSSRVTSDLKRLCDTVATAITARPAEAIRLYAVGLDLIEVTPGSPIDHSWNWWIHYAAIAERAAVQAACNLARLTIDTKGDLDVARHGITQARAVSPYAEELYRSAIELAGAAGNLGWAQREWDELRRMLTDLSPGASPSLATEAVYRAAMQQNLQDEIDRERNPLPLAAGLR
jgi:DNA-binding SARP family transcriptional activator